MTKYILHGGATGNKSADNKKFFFEMTNGLEDIAAILCVYFAKDKKLWPKLLEEDKLSFSSAAPEKILKLSVADEDARVLIEQIKKADVIYLRGGKTSKLQEILSKIKNLDELWKGKVVGGASAGAYVLAKYYQGDDNDVYADVIGHGLGILPIKVFAHYTEEHKNQLKNLENYGEDLKAFTIPEEKFFIIEV
jgi:peptidase E